MPAYIWGGQSKGQMPGHRFPCRAEGTGSGGLLGTTVLPSSIPTSYQSLCQHSYYGGENVNGIVAWLRTGFVRIRAPLMQSFSERESQLPQLIRYRYGNAAMRQHSVHSADRSISDADRHDCQTLAHIPHCLAQRGNARSFNRNISWKIRQDSSGVPRRQNTRGV